MKPPQRNEFPCGSRSRHLRRFGSVAEDQISALHLPPVRSVKPRSVSLLTSLAWKERKRASELHREIDLRLVRDLAKSSFATSESSGQETSVSRFIIPFSSHLTLPILSSRSQASRSLWPRTSLSLGTGQRKKNTSCAMASFY